MDMSIQRTSIVDVIDELGPEFQARAAETDREDRFVTENFAALREHKLFAAIIPTELGGAGASYTELCEAVRKLGSYCGPTALTFSMHQHLVSAATFNYRNGKPGQAMLEKVAANDLILVSTGATDWLDSNGEVEKVDGGYSVSAKKYFASGCLAGDVLVTTAPYEDPDEGWIVMHFPVPIKSEGVSIEENWHAIGMRGTGSHTAVLENVFVPEEAVVLRRPKGKFHPVWNVVLGVALPLIMSPYVGIAEAAATEARNMASKRQDDAARPYLLGEMENALTTAKLAWESMVAMANNLDFEPSLDHTNEIVQRKTICINAAMEVTRKAMEASGGPGYLQAFTTERLFRDSLAGQFHPMQQKRQHLFTGRMAMGLDPVEE